jgi:hypothetical protein
MVPPLTPILYLPGFGRHHLRAIEDCAAEVRLVAEMQYRGAWFSQGNGRDWTPLAFLANKEQGFGLEISGHGSVGDAIQATLSRLVVEPVSRLRERSPLSAADFYELGEADVIGSVLRWMDDPDRFQAEHHDWASFRQLCKKKLGFDPEEDTAIGAAYRLGTRSGDWARAWSRFAEAPTNYPRLPELLRVARPPAAAQSELFKVSGEAVWPQDNEDAEDSLRGELLGLANRPLIEVRSAVAALDAEHAVRRTSVWARLDRTPLASALEHLTSLASETTAPIGGATCHTTVAGYVSDGWRADDAMIRALGVVDRSEDLAAVAAVAAALYRPWAEAGVTHFLDRVRTDGLGWSPPSAITAGSCRLFTDGLRFDLGQRLADELRRRELDVDVRSFVAAVPTVTATAKPAIAPVGPLLAAGDGLGTKVERTGSPTTAEGLRRLLADEGVQALAPHEFGDPTGRGWTELGDIDQLGHAQGLRLPRYVDDQIRSIADRVAALMKAGWRQVEVVTDHGWILDPLGLEKVAPALSDALTLVRKGRCARVKDRATVEFPTLPWHWDASVDIAVAPGLRAFEAGKHYEHGGVSLQESVTPWLTVRRGGEPVAVALTEVRWVGLRCRVHVDDAHPGAAIDLRLNPAQPDSSIAVHVSEIDLDGNTSLLVASDEHEGIAAAIVVISPDGTVLGQQPTIVGGS